MINIIYLCKLRIIFFNPVCNSNLVTFSISKYSLKILSCLFSLFSLNEQKLNNIQAIFLINMAWQNFNIFISSHIVTHKKYIENCNSFCPEVRIKKALKSRHVCFLLNLKYKKLCYYLYSFC